MSNDDTPDLQPDRLRRAARSGAPAAPEGLGASLVARGRRRTRRQQLGAGLAAVAMFGFGIAAMGELDERRAAPVVTNPVEGLPSVEVVDPDPESSADTVDSEAGDGVGAQPAPAATPTIDPTALPTELPTPRPSPSASPSSSPSPTPSSSASEPVDDGTNDGATDTGVTGDEVVIYVLIEETGATPYWHDRSAQWAMEAFAAYAEESLGHIHGRKVRVEFRDAKYDPNSALQVAREACTEGFAVVGAHLAPYSQRTVAEFADCPMLFSEVPGWSAPDNPWVSWIRSRWPDSPGAVRFRPWRDIVGRASSPSSGWLAYGARERDGKVPTDGDADEDGHEDWIDMVQGRLADTELVDWTVDGRVQYGDTAWYSERARQFADRGVEFARLDLQPVDAVRFAQQLAQQDATPEVLMLWDRLYADEVLQSAGGDLEGARVVVDHLPWTERRRSPVIDRYLTWMRQVDQDRLLSAQLPSGKVPTTPGLHAWAAAERFIEDLRAMGGAPTREGLRERWASAQGWDAQGALAPRSLQQVAEPRCWVIVEADAATARFERASGDQGGFSC